MLHCIAFFSIFGFNLHWTSWYSLDISTCLPACLPTYLSLSVCFDRIYVPIYHMCVCVVFSNFLRKKKSSSLLFYRRKKKYNLSIFSYFEFYTKYIVCSDDDGGRYLFHDWFSFSLFAAVQHFYQYWWWLLL